MPRSFEHLKLAHDRQVRADLLGVGVAQLEGLALF